MHRRRVHMGNIHGAHGHGKHHRRTVIGIVIGSAAGADWRDGAAVGRCVGGEEAAVRVVVCVHWASAGWDGNGATAAWGDDTSTE